MLRPFTKADYPTLIDWVDTPELLFRFSGPDINFPLTTEKVDQHIQSHPNRHYYIAVDPELGDYAFGEVIPQEKNVPRLARLLVGRRDLRGKGLGVRFIRLLLDECVRLYGPNRVELYVLLDNDAAIRCYQKVGFQFIPGSEVPMNFEGKMYLGRKMFIDLDQNPASI